jgi:chitodextrinase
LDTLVKGLEEAYDINGSQVSWADHNWRAKGWTRGEEPGTTGQWGVWVDLGAC